MLQPKQQKHRKEFRGKMKGLATANNQISYGEYGIKALECGWVNAREIEAARRAIAGYTKRKRLPDVLAALFFLWLRLGFAANLYPIRVRIYANR